MQKKTLTIYKLNGDPWRIFIDSIQWQVDDNGVLWVSGIMVGGASTHTISTTLPFSIEETA